MNSNEIAYLILRILSLYIIITNLDFPMLYLYPFIFNSGHSSYDPINIVSMIIGLCPLLFGLYLWISAKKLIPLFVLEKTLVQMPQNHQSLNILKLATMIMGLFLMVTYLPLLFADSVLYFQMAESDAYLNGGHINPAYLQNIMIHSVSLVIGFSLIVGNNFYIKALHYARHMWLDKK